MKNHFEQLVFIIASVFISNLSFSQKPEIQVKFIGNCGMYLTDGNMNIYTYFTYKYGAFNQMEFGFRN